MGQGFSSGVNSQAFVGSDTFTISGGTYGAGKTYVLFVATTAFSGGVPSDNPAISSGPLVLTKIATVTNAVSRLIVYTFTPSATVSQTITLTYAESQGQHFRAMYEGTGLAGMTLSVVTGSGTDANPSIAAPSIATSYTVGYFFNNKNPFGGTPESGWAESFDTGTATPYGHAGYHRNATTDNTVQVTAAASNWLGAAVQFTGRRVFTIN